MAEYTPVWMEKDGMRKQALTAEVKKLLEADGWSVAKAPKEEKGK